MTRILLMIAITLTSCDAQMFRLGVERTRNLGHGFHRDVIAEKNPPGTFESVGHFEYLFYRHRKLCHLNYECAVAPSGKAVIYQDGPTGFIYVFRPANAKPIQLTKEFFGIIDDYEWHESEGFVRVVADKGRPSQKERILTVPK